jgi:hypothetical protein
MKTNKSQKISSFIMNIYNNKLFITICLICVFVFAFYNIISPAYTCSLNIEGFDAGNFYTGNASNSNPFDAKYDTSMMQKFSKMFGNSHKCLAGCYSPTTSSDPDIKDCKQNVSMPNSNKLYKKCSWKCDKKFLDNLKSNPERSAEYAEYIKKEYKACEINEHCTACTPHAYL